MKNNVHIIYLTNRLIPWHITHTVVGLFKKFWNISLQRNQLKYFIYIFFLELSYYGENNGESIIFMRMLIWKLHNLIYTA